MDLLRRTRHEQRSHQTWLIAAVIIGAAALGGDRLTGCRTHHRRRRTPACRGYLSAGRAEKWAIARLEAAEAWTRRLSDIVAAIGLQQAIGATAATAPGALSRIHPSVICGMRGRPSVRLAE